MHPSYALGDSPHFGDDGGQFRRPSHADKPDFLEQPDGVVEFAASVLELQ
jgi:hypothetical protein